MDFTRNHQKRERHRAATRFLFNQIAHVAERVYAMTEGVGDIPIQYATFEAGGYSTLNFMAHSNHNIHFRHSQIAQTL